MPCPDVVARLSPYLDGELEAEEHRAISEHLASCSSCAAALAQQKDLSERLRTDLEYHRATDLLRARVVRDLDAFTRSARPGERAGSRNWRWARAAAAVVVVLAGAWFTMSLKTRAAGEEAIAREAVSNHQRSLTRNHLADIASSDPRRVRPWLDERLDFSPPVTDFADAGFALVGARVDYLNGRPVAAIVYEHGGHVVNVYVSQTTDAGPEVSDVTSHNGYRVVRATYGKLAYCLVSDLDAATLRAFARVVAGPLNRGGSPLPGERR